MSAEEKTAVSTEKAGDEKEVVVPGATEDETSTPDESAPPEKRVAPDQETGDEEAEAETEEKPKRPGGFQRRIRKLAAQRAAAEASAEYWREQALTGKAKPEKEEVAVVGGKPKPRQEDFQLKEEDGGGSDIAAFTEALADWKVDQRLDERDAKATESQAQTEKQSQNQVFLEREAAFAEAHDDYEDMADAALGTLGQLKSPTAAQLSGALAASEQGPELLYYLGQHPDELQRITKLKPQAAVMSLGGIVASLARTEEKGIEVETQTPLVSGAPKPPTPIKKPAGGKKVRPDDPGTADGMTDEEWLKARNAQVRSRA